MIGYTKFDSPYHPFFISRSIEKEVHMKLSETLYGHIIQSNNDILMSI